MDDEDTSPLVIPSKRIQLLTRDFHQSEDDPGKPPMLCAFIDVSIHRCVHPSMCASIDVCIYACVHPCMCVCVYSWICELQFLQSFINS